MSRRWTPPLGQARSLLLLSLLAALVGARAAESVEPGAEADPKPVRLVVDYGDGVQKHFTHLHWRENMTVLDALRLAHQHPRGIQLQYRGRAATVLVTQIDELENQGGTGRNWIYEVNKKPGSRSCGIQPLEPGDTVLWKFETYR